MVEGFNPTKFIEFLRIDFDNFKDNQKETERYFIILKDFFGNIYRNSEPFEKDKRRKPRDKLLYVEDDLNKIEEHLKSFLLENSFNELKKIFKQIKERHESPFGQEINFIWNSGEIRNLSKDTLILLKELQKKKLPNLHIPYAIDFD